MANERCFPNTLLKVFEKIDRTPPPVVDLHWSSTILDIGNDTKNNKKQKIDRQTNKKQHRRGGREDSKNQCFPLLNPVL
jgi:hypothetical protein